MRKFLPPFLLALLACGFTACATPDFITAGLKIEVTGIERAADGSAQVTWRIGNPNVFSYLLSRTNHKLSLNGQAVGTFSDESPLGVPAQSHMTRTSGLKSAGPAANGILDQAVAQGSAAYRLDSTLLVLIVDDKNEKIPLTNSGTVPVTAK